MNFNDTIKTCKKEFFRHNEGSKYNVFPIDIYTEDKHFEYITSEAHLMTKDFYIEHFYTGKIEYFLE